MTLTSYTLWTHHSAHHQCKWTRLGFHQAQGIKGGETQMSRFGRAWQLQVHLPRQFDDRYHQNCIIIIVITIIYHHSGQVVETLRVVQWTM